MSGLLWLLSRFKTVIYLGKNTDGRACAWPGFFDEMSHRPVLDHIPDRRNTLIVWGKKDKNLKREFLLEEVAGMDWSKCYSFVDEQ
jgi:hypothetical protein